MNTNLYPEHYSIPLKKLPIRAAILAFAILAFGTIDAQIDTLLFANGNMLIGEIKSMKNNVVQIETDYSDSDFKIEWDEVVEIYTSTYFLVNTEDGARVNGVLRSDPTDSTMVIVGLGAGAHRTELDKIVFLQSVKKKIWSRFDILLELGFNITKANNLKQFSSRTGLGYTADTWSANASYNSVFSEQDSAAQTKRTDAAIGANWYLPNDWYVMAQATFLQNDEQKLKLRSTPSAGVGKYFVRNNNWNFTTAVGLAYNIEQFQTDQANRSSLEAFIQAQVVLFNTGDLSTNLTVSAFPSLTESGRFRTDITWDIKYEFFDDFYIKLGTTFNFDNRPAAGASETDYVFQTTVGWEL